MARTKKQPTVATRVGDLVDERNHLQAKVAELEEKLAKATKQLEQLPKLKAMVKALRSENQRLHNDQAAIESKIAGQSSAKPKRKYTRKATTKKGKKATNGEPSEEGILTYLRKVQGA